MALPASVSSDQPAVHLALSPDHPALAEGSPFLLDPITSEPYIAVPDTNLIVTPARVTDIPHHVALLNHPSVDPYVFSPPKPYTETHATDRILLNRKWELEIFDKWAKGEGVTGLPVGTIREKREGREDVFVGTLGVTRENSLVEIKEEEERKKVVELNVRRTAGDPEILWTWFFLMVQDFTGKGYMTRTLRHIFDSFLLPPHLLNLHSLISYAFVGNAGSRAVHLKLGFVEEGTDWIKMPEYRGGVMREEWIFRWTRGQV